MYTAKFASTLDEDLPLLPNQPDRCFAHQTISLAQTVNDIA